MLIVTPLHVRAEVQTRFIEYEFDGTVFEGYFAWDSRIDGPRPGVIVIHDWDGPDDYEQMRARMLAQLGYAAFAIDVYGKGVRPRNPQESATEARKMYSDLDTFRTRVIRGLRVLGDQPEADGSRLAAIGYCFGGAGVLELMRSGTALAGVVSFHGSLNTSRPAVRGEVRTRVLAFHAAQDPAVPRAHLETFLDEMRDAQVDYQMVIYNLAAHAFTKPGGAQYDATADRRSWAQMQAFLTEVFANPATPE